MGNNDLLGDLSYALNSQGARPHSPKLFRDKEQYK